MKQQMAQLTMTTYIKYEGTTYFIETLLIKKFCSGKLFTYCQNVKTAGKVAITQLGVELQL